MITQVAPGRNIKPVEVIVCCAIAWREALRPYWRLFLIIFDYFLLG
ncbi:hypothetical protein [Planktothricoides raciborskii]|uniref:Uncharacterized protein n=1 Tax=Planktothricoides raciborskii FACHB-1370 TaxID=2949576 RepID=A0ABR8EHF4_9CYAN|nr:hypothetical protein [Planktothricoides raciborskii]MBD2545578.1 hypothetical protein [Planktothricoides raciborskii FACHB-1370]MBD2583484.1 hypothetical protein [Planktothricoides raciborskii FACHB-1261]